MSSWYVSELGSEFSSDVDDIIIQFLKSKWTEANPALAPDTPTDIDKRNKLVVGEQDFPNDMTYYLQVTEGDADISSHDIRTDLFTYKQQILLEMYARRIQPRENFPQLNNMANHLMKIFGQYKHAETTDIPGIQAVKLVRLSRFHTPRITHVTNLYHRTLTIEITYFRQDASL